MQKQHRKYTNIVMNIVMYIQELGASNGTFSLQDKDDTMPYQVLPKQLANAIHEPFKKELERL